MLHNTASPPLVYADQFKRHCQQRWTFLVREMGLSYADICACRLLLQTSLLNTLAPRWHLLILLETVRSDFKAADHLTALATLFDEHFAQAFSSALWVWYMARTSYIVLVATCVDSVTQTKFCFA
ncbi:hypothetical protein ABBQ32_008088 [Trebouxia sp. C0010 RCD-2024]